MFLLFRIAQLNIRGNKKLAFLFCLNLMTGLLGLSLVDGFKISLKDSISSQSKKIATADLQLSVRRNFTTDEQRAAQSSLAPWAPEFTQTTSFYSMASSGQKSRLFEIKGIEENYPLYGNFTFSEQSEDPALRPNHTTAWVYPEVAKQLQIRINDSVLLGNQLFKITAIIKDDAGAAWVGSSVAPRIYIHRTNIGVTKLIQKGSSITHTFLYQFKTDRDTELAEKAIKEAFKQPGVRIQTHTESSEQAGILVRYLNDYLGLVTLTAFFLAMIGSAFLYRTYLSQRLTDTAILKSLGMTSTRASIIPLAELLGLSTISAIGASILSLAFLPVLASLLSELFPVPLNFGFSLKSLLMTIIFGTLGTLAICGPILAASTRLKPSSLFQEATIPYLKLKTSDWLKFCPAIFLFWIASCWQCQSWKLGTVFSGLFYFAALATFLTGHLLIHFFRTKKGSWALQLARLQIERLRFAALSCFTAITLATMLILLIPALKLSIEKEILTPADEPLPSLFMFDIQDEQQPLVTQSLTKLDTKPILMSPMIQAKLRKINNQLTSRTDAKLGDIETREQEQERVSSNRDFNLTFREKLDDSEKIVAGKAFAGPWLQGEELAEISLEERFADRLKVGINDILEFDVMGIPVTGKITSLRKVRWTSFRPNFFIQFQPGVLEDAPKTFVAAIPQYDSAKKDELLETISAEFPNISIIDVSRLVSKLMELTDRISSAMILMAFFSLAAGAMTLFSIARQQMATRVWDIALLKVLGASHQEILVSILWEFGILTSAASFVGCILSESLNWTLCKIIFDASYTFNPLLSLGIITGITILAIFIAFLASAPVLRNKPLAILQID